MTIKLLPVSEEERPHLAAVRSWLDTDDPFFDAMEGIARDRSAHVPRVVRGKPQVRESKTR
jgi:hypothetical protein